MGKSFSKIYIFYNSIDEIEEYKDIGNILFACSRRIDDILYIHNYGPYSGSTDIPKLFASGFYYQFYKKDYNAMAGFYNLCTGDIYTNFCTAYFYKTSGDNYSAIKILEGLSKRNEYIYSKFSVEMLCVLGELYLSILKMDKGYISLRNSLYKALGYDIRHNPENSVLYHYYYYMFNEYGKKIFKDCILTTFIFDELKSVDFKNRDQLLDVYEHYCELIKND